MRIIEAIERKVQNLYGDIELKPDFNENQLITYFERKIDKLDPELIGADFNRGLPCEAASRLIVMDLGGVKVARIWWVEQDGHAYVVKNGQKEGELAFNNDYSGSKRTVGFVKSNGRDDTDKIFDSTWDDLDMHVAY